MGLVRQYLLLSGVQPTIPTDPEANVILYVTVSVFGLVRSRFDAHLFNQESVIAETAIEMTAFDKQGNIIMRPRMPKPASVSHLCLMAAGALSFTM